MHEKPPSSAPHRPDNVRRDAEFRQYAGSLTRDSAAPHQSARRPATGDRGGTQGIEEEQRAGSELVLPDGHCSPLPPCLAGHVGRSRYADRLRPCFFGIVFPERRDPTSLAGRAATGPGAPIRSLWRRTAGGPNDDELVEWIIPSLAARLACVRVAAPYGRRTAPD